jgi:hypothetical protein
MCSASEGVGSLDHRVRVLLKEQDDSCPSLARQGVADIRGQSLGRLTFEPAAFLLRLALGPGQHPNVQIPSRHGTWGRVKRGKWKWSDGTMEPMPPLWCEGRLCGRRAGGLLRATVQGRRRGVGQIPNVLLCHPLLNAQSSGGSAGCRSKGPGRHPLRPVSYLASLTHLGGVSEDLRR